MLKNNPEYKSHHHKFYSQSVNSSPRTLQQLNSNNSLQSLNNIKNNYSKPTIETVKQTYYETKSNYSQKIGQFPDNKSVECVPYESVRKMNINEDRARKEMKKFYDKQIHRYSQSNININKKNNGKQQLNEEESDNYNYSQKKPNNNQIIRQRFRNNDSLKKIGIRPNLKLSMKNKQQTIKTPHQNHHKINNFSNISISESINSSRFMAQSDSPIIKHFQSILKNEKQKFSQALLLQQKHIQKCSQKIYNLQNLLAQKQKRIVLIKQKLFEQNINRFRGLETKLNYILNTLNPQNQSVQSLINKRLDKIEKVIHQAPLNNRSQDQTYKRLIVFLQKTNQYQKIIINKIYADLTNLKSQFHCFQSIFFQNKTFKDVILKSSVSTSPGTKESNVDMMSETAKFRQNITQYELQYDQQKMNDSLTYFFHPSQLKNFEKISQLFQFRQQNPISCIVDKQNRLKYSQSGTYLFDRKGNPLILNENQLKYYADRGFIEYSRQYI